MSRGVVCCLSLAWAACTEVNPDATHETGGSDTTRGTQGTDDAATDPTMSSADDDDSSSGPSPTSDPDTSGGTNECALGTHTCVSAPPQGWSGPAALRLDPVSSGRMPCEGDYDEDATSAFHELSGDPANCTCMCGEATDLSCEGWTVEFDDALGCMSPNESFDFLGICLNAPSTAQGYWSAEPSASSGGSCEPNGTMDVPPAAFGGRTTVCAYAGPQDGCGPGQRCVPIPTSPFEPAICVWQAGELDCPVELGFVDRRVVYDEFTDDRACGACTCGDPVGTCTVEIEFHSDTCGGGVDDTIVTDGSCHNVSSVVESLTADDATLAIEAECAPSRGEPTGGVAGTGPTTICCRG